MSIIPKLQAGQWPTSADFDAALVTLQSFDPDSLPADDLAGLPPGSLSPAAATVPDTLGDLLGIPPIVQEVGDDIELAFDILDIIAWCFVESPFPLIDLIGALIIIVEKLIKLFTGRPRAEATLTAATNLLNAKNTAAIIAGNNLVRLLNQFDIVISESGPGEALVAAVVSQFADNLVAQGIPQATARNIVLNQLTLGANRQGFIAPQLQKAPPNDLIIQGTTGFQNNFSRIEKWLEDHGHGPIEADRLTWQFLLQNAPLKWLFRIKYQPPGTPPPPPPCPPGYAWNPITEQCEQLAQQHPPHPCPPGFHWDYTIGVCVPDTSNPDPQGDEIVNQLCKQMADNTAAVIKAINGLQATGNGSDPTCCANLVAAIGDVQSTLADLAAAFPLADNVAQLVAPLNMIATALSNFATAAPPVDLTATNAELDKIAAAIGSGAPFDQTNLKSIADSQSTIVRQWDVKQPILDKIYELGGIPDEFKAVLQGADPGDAMSTVEAFRQRIANSHWWQDFSNAVRWIEYWSLSDPSTAVPPKLGDKGFTLKQASDGITNLAKGLLTAGFTLADDLFGPPVRGFLDAHKNEIAKLGIVRPGSELEGANALLTEATTFGVGAHYAAVLGETIYPTKTLGFPQLAAMLATLSGYEEIVKGLVGSEVAALITTPHRYAINAQARSLLPGLSAALGMRARGIIDDATRDSLVAFNGLSPDHAADEQTAAYHGYSPRALLRVIESGLFTQDEIHDELTFSGMRPASQARLLKAAPYLATQPYRSELRNSLHAAAVAGLLSDKELTDQVDAAESNMDRDNLILARLRLDKRLGAVKELENAYSIQYIGHLIDLPTYQSYLDGLGLASDTVNNLMAVAEAKSNAAIERQLEAEERALERQTKSDLRKAAIRNFKNGTIDAAALSAALVATGLSPLQTAAWTNLASLEQIGAARYLYGQLLTPDNYRLLDERVAAIETQYKKQLITLHDARAQLVTLGIDGHDLAAILAKWAAAVGAQNKHGQLLDVITGIPKTQ